MQIRRRALLLSGTRPGAGAARSPHARTRTFPSDAAPLAVYLARARVCRRSGRGPGAASLREAVHGAARDATGRTGLGANALAHVSRPLRTLRGHPHHQGRVLLVEDEPDQAAILEAVLRHEGLDVVVAASGEQALDIHQRTPA